MNNTNILGEELVHRYCCLMQKELYFRQQKSLDFISIQVYLKNLFRPDLSLIPLGILGYSQRLELMISELKKLSSGSKILDAGCGYGTESILFSSLGHDVTGVELVKERTELAKSRVDFFSSAVFPDLKIQFINANIFKFLQESKPWDVIWIMEAISHIYPPEKFLTLTYKKLKPGGKLIISDPNKINPLALIRSIKIRGSIRHKTHTRFMDPHTGKPVDYGQEKIYSVFKFQKILKKCGFEIEKVHISGFLGASFLPNTLLTSKAAYKILSFIQKNFQKLPGIRYCGSLYTIVAAKKPDN